MWAAAMVPGSGRVVGDGEGERARLAAGSETRSFPEKLLP